MKTIKCSSGNEFDIAVAYGVMSQLEGTVFSMVSDETMEKLKTGMNEGATIEQTEAEAEKAAFAAFDGKALRDFLSANRKQGPHMLATVLRKMNGNHLGDFDQRMAFVEDELDYEDGMEIMEVVNDQLQKVQKGRQQKGKSKPTSQTRPEKEALASPPAQ